MIVWAKGFVDKSKEPGDAGYEITGATVTFTVYDSDGATVLGPVAMTDPDALNNYYGVMTPAQTAAMTVGDRLRVEATADGGGNLKAIKSGYLRVTDPVFDDTNE
jgi:hypothetical protein